MKLRYILLFATMLFILHSFGQYHLPVEVLGEEGKVVVTEIELNNTTANAAKRLWLQVNNLGYQDKASVKINDGSWIKLNHQTATIQKQELARGGMVHGGFNTIRLSIPADNWTNGNNTIRFRFNESDGISMGYRVIKVNLLNSGGEMLLEESAFSHENPDTWEGPYTDQASINQGENLWRNGQLWANYLPAGRNGQWYDIEIIGNETNQIKATCSDCHTQDGRDLEIFAYSNESIIERSKFHGMSEEQGKLITSYIRSLSENDESINRHGRPWNPPFQPGKELMGKTIEDWAAGAGLDAVLDEDADMLSYLFPDGVSEETADDHFQHDTRDLNRTEIPLAIQLPDWKHWLPMIHPKDAFSKGSVYKDTYNDDSPWRGGSASVLNPERGYEQFRAYLETLPKKSDGKTVNIAALSNSEKEEFLEKHEEFHSNFRHFFIQQKNGGSHWRTDHGPYYNALGVHEQFGKTSMARLLAVKNFELMVEFGLQDQAKDLYNTGDFPQPRQWLNGRSHHVFEVPAHFTACDDGADCQHFDGQSTATGQFESSAWYELQQILAGGEGYQWWNGPVDYNYHPQFILKASNSSNIMEPLRYYNCIRTMYKVKSWSGGQDVSDGYGYRIRQQGPWRFFGKQGIRSKNGFYGHTPGDWAFYLDDVQPGLSKIMLGAMFQDFLDAVSIQDLSTWPRDDKDAREGHFLGPINQSSYIDVTKNVSVPKDRPIWADNMMWVIPQAIEHGVDCKVLNDVIDWCDEAWPRMNFNQFKNKVEPTVDLFHNTDCPNEIEARVTNTGNNPSFVWEVNGSQIGETSMFLSSDYFEESDVVSVRVNGTASCANKTGPTEDEIRITSDDPCNVTVIVPIDSAYYDMDDVDYSAGITDQWNSHQLTNHEATRISDGNNTVARFDGIDDVMMSGENELQFNSANMTIEAWINMNTTLGSTQRIVTLDPNGAFFFRITPVGKLQVVNNSDNGPNVRQSINSNAVIPSNEWTHLACVISTSEARLYVNGVLDNTANLNAPFDYDVKGQGLSLSIGGTGATPEGMIDEVKIYNRQLSAGEIDASYYSYSIINGTHETSRNMELAVYPNPANDQLSVELFNHSGTVQVSLVSVDGKKIFMQEHNGMSNTIQLDLSTYNIPQGTYFLQVEGENSSVTQTVFINQSKN